MGQPGARRKVAPDELIHENGGGNVGDQSRESRADKRRRRTERQRESREQARVCGHCQGAADGGLLEWRGRRSPLLIPICSACRARLAGRWRDMGQVGPWCPVNEARPCGDCGTGERRNEGFLRRLLLG